jgi:hypothetical protein
VRLLLISTLIAHRLICVGTNKAIDFFELIVNFLNQGVLTRGDILVLDNAKIHKAAEILGMLSIILDAAGVHMYFLPTYSPEVLLSASLFSSMTAFVSVQPLRVGVCPCKAILKG